MTSVPIFPTRLQYALAYIGTREYREDIQIISSLSVSRGRVYWPGINRDEHLHSKSTEQEWHLLGQTVVRFARHLTTSFDFYLSVPTRYGATRFLQFIHMVSFASWMGSMMWVTFIAGITMARNMPRQTSGKIQVWGAQTAHLLSRVHGRLLHLYEDVENACALSSTANVDGFMPLLI